ncbi:MAG TPA: ATP-binding protein, partial [Polyangiaceae bacterium]|nr:ATP-binding protein [Polyangiaceae bacterium]
MKRKTSVPLAYRVPNAPATFVGRRDELRAIKAAARRGPVVALCGAGGLGKTALAFAAIHGVFADRASRAVMVSLRASQPLRQTLFDVVQALEHFGREEVAMPRGTDAELTSVAIDLAEAHEAIILLDDLHHGLPAVGSVLQSIARYARRSTWLVTSRVPLAVPELVGQMISLGPLGERHLVQIARLVDPRLARGRAEEIAQDAAGSPWKLRRLVGAPSDGRDEPLEGVDDLGRTVLEVLSLVERPIAGVAIERAAGADVRAALAELGHRGLVEEVAGGHRLHEAARPWAVEWLATSSRETTRRRAVVALASSGPSEAVEALRLSIEWGEREQALAICEASFDDMLRAGHAPTLWKLISSQREPA